MSSFTNALILQELHGGVNFRVVRGFKYHLKKEGSDIFVDVEDGFKTDLTSKFGRRLFKGNAAAVVHDHLYSHATVKVKFVGGTIRSFSVDQKQADLIFLEAMKVKKVGYLRRHAYYFAVRLRGHVHWNKYRARDAVRTPPLEPLPDRYKL